jgi:hypothetical protein
MVLARRELNRWSKRAEAEAEGGLEPRNARGRSELIIRFDNLTLWLASRQRQ